jgi:hypothetical protein
MQRYRSALEEIERLRAQINEALFADRITHTAVNEVRYPESLSLSQ